MVYYVGKHVEKECVTDFFLLQRGAAAGKPQRFRITAFRFGVVYLIRVQRICTVTARHVICMIELPDMFREQGWYRV